MSVSSIDKFNKNLEQFLLIVINNYPDQKTSIERYQHYTYLYPSGF